MNGMLNFLVIDPAFQEGHRQRVADPPALRYDLECALRCAVEDTYEDAPVLVIRTALALVTFQDRQLQPASLFELAREGRLQEAEKRLALFHPEEPWRQAVLLTLAWQAAAAGHDDPSSALLVRLRQEIPPYDPTLEMLLQRVRSATEPGVAPPPANLPGPPDLFTVSQILERLGGTALTPIEPLLISGLQQLGDEAPAYLAKQDGPLLVAFANEDPQHHTAYLKQYIALQASNPYGYYRNRSLWVLISYIVQHKDPGWILDVLQDLMAGALTRTRIGFRSALPLTLQALHARRGDAAALQALEEERKSTVERVRNLSPGRGEGDPWAHDLRRLAALAEVYARVLDRPTEARQLLDEALNLHFNSNFAGFRAPACLTLAESLRICGWDDRGTIERALYAAQAAAHNIQDAEFCAQMTARVNAIWARWWPAPPETIDLESTIGLFASDPRKANFAPLHRVCNTYHHRTDLLTRLPLSDGMRTSRTFWEIGHIYPSMRLEAEEAALALNLQLQPPDQPLPEGTWINIIDPDFVPLLAVRLSAEVLVANGLLHWERTSLIQHLVPLSVANCTALDTVVARLLMAVLPQDIAALESLAQAAEETGSRG